MSSIPYTPNPSSLSKFLNHIQTAGIPTKVNRDYLTSVGFKSSNDRYLIPIFKAIGFLDASGQPTQRWRDFRDKNKSRTILGEGIQQAYRDLFDTYPDAHRKDNEAIRNFFASRTDWGTATLDRAVSTFKSLCSMATFGDGAPSTLPEIESSGEEPPPTASIPRSRTSEPAITLNIQLELPATSDADVYDKLFAAMRKHLFRDGTDSA